MSFLLKGTLLGSGTLGANLANDYLVEWSSGSCSPTLRISCAAAGSDYIWQLPAGNDCDGQIQDEWMVGLSPSSGYYSGRALPEDGDIVNDNLVVVYATRWNNAGGSVSSFLNYVRFVTVDKDRNQWKASNIFDYDSSSWGRRIQMASDATF